MFGRKKQQQLEREYIRYLELTVARFCEMAHQRRIRMPPFVAQSPTLDGSISPRTYALDTINRRINEAIECAEVKY